MCQSGSLFDRNKKKINGIGERIRHRANVIKIDIFTAANIDISITHLSAVDRHIRRYTFDSIGRFMGGAIP